MSGESSISQKGHQPHNGVFTLPDTDADTDTNKKWVIENCVEVFTLPNTDTGTDTDTDTDANGLQTHFVSVSVCIGVCVGQCEHSIRVAWKLRILEWVRPKFFFVDLLLETVIKHKAIDFIQCLSK